ncbi:MAG: hypothetical protein NC293_02745 [Roseburia sp.]|nr:hypothetical protein [Roseburia sp.]
MEIIQLKNQTASFTVEAVFVMSITVWVLFAVCYLSLYAHDRTAVYSLGESFLEKTVENGKDWEERETASRLRDYLEEHLMISQVREVSVKKSLLSVSAEVLFCVDIQIPFLKKMLTGEDGKQVHLSHEKIFPSYYMWDSEAAEDILK